MMDDSAWNQSACSDMIAEHTPSTTTTTHTPHTHTHTHTYTHTQATAQLSKLEADAAALRGQLQQREEEMGRQVRGMHTHVYSYI